MTGFSASARSREAELMDDPDVDYATFRDCLVDLARVNRLSLGYRPTLNFLDEIAQGHEGALTVLDVGSGYGDALRAVAVWARRRDIPVRLIGVDLSPHATRAARAATPDWMAIEHRTADMFALEPDLKVDVVLSALFAHHLDDAGLVRFLRWMERAAVRGWFVNDLRRSRLAFHGFRFASAALGMHRFVRHDGPVSFARAFVAEDWRRTLREAGLAPSDARIARAMPFRLCVSRVKP